MSTKWGAKQDVLKTTYKSYIRTVIDYESEVNVITSTNMLGKSNFKQNTALRVITGTDKSILVMALEAQFQIDLLQVQQEKAALRF